MTNPASYETAILKTVVTSVGPSGIGGLSAAQFLFAKISFLLCRPQPARCLPVVCQLFCQNNVQAQRNNVQAPKKRIWVTKKVVSSTEDFLNANEETKCHAPHPEPLPLQDKQKKQQEMRTTLH